MKAKLKAVNSTHLSKFLSFPIFLFIGVVLVAFISIFGSHWTSGQGGLSTIEVSVGQVASANTSSSSVINQCAFREAGVPPCETESAADNLDLTRNLVLQYDATSGTWNGGWVATAQIESLPALGYFALIGYSGAAGSADFPSQGNSLDRLSFGSIKDPATGDILYYDLTKQVPGFALLLDQYGNTLGNIGYVGGSGVLLGAIGDFTDDVKSFSVPKQFLVDLSTYQQLENNTELDTTHSSTIAEKAWEWLQRFFALLFGDQKKCKDTQFPIEALYTKNSTKGDSSIFSQGTYRFTLSDVIQKSNLMSTIGLECEKDVSGVCKIATDLASCNTCIDVQVPANPNTPGAICPSYDPTSCFVYEKKCDIEYEGGEIKISDEGKVRQCILSRGSLTAVHTTGTGSKLVLGGVGNILETYWKRVQRISPRKICHMKNIGIEAKVTSYLYDKLVDFGSLDDISVPVKEDSCSSDPEFTSDRRSQISTTLSAYYPYLGTIIQSSIKYIDAKQTAIDSDITDLPDCPDTDSQTGLCYCAEGQIDPLAEYLYYIGTLRSEELASLGLNEADIIQDVGAIEGGLPEDVTTYNGSCQEIFDAVKQESPYSESANVQGTSLELIDDSSFNGCDAITPGKIKCKRSLLEPWCNSCPIKAGALFRHEFNHKMNYLIPKSSGNKLREFAADATSANGGWYVFKYKGLDSWMWATAIRDRIIDEYVIGKDTLMSYLYGMDANAAAIIKSEGIDLDQIVTAIDGPIGVTPPDLRDCSK